MSSLTMARALRQKIVFASVVILSQSTIAQNVGEVCNAALSKGQITDNLDLLSDEQVFSQYKSRLCDQKFSSLSAFESGAASLGLDVPLAKGMLGLDASGETSSSKFQQSYSKFCTSTFSSFEQKNLFRLQRASISSTLINGWVDCMRIQKDAYLNKYGIFSVVRLQDYGTFDVEVSVNRGREVGNVIVNAIFPDRQVTCTRDGKPVRGGTQIDTYQFGMTCRKDAAKPAIFAIETKQGRSQQTEIPAAPTAQAIEDARLTKLAVDFAQRSLFAGEIRTFAVSEANTQYLERLRMLGWIPAEGQALPKSSYQDLWLAIGDTWGKHADAGMFYLPDLRGRFVRGYSGESGVDPDKASRTICRNGGAAGNRVGSCQDDSLQTHRHIDSGHAHATNIAAWTNRNSQLSAYDQGAGGGIIGTSVAQANIGGPVEASVSSETRPRNVSLYLFIYTGRQLK